jgi:hypothetical protein
MSQVAFRVHGDAYQAWQDIKVCTAYDALNVVCEADNAAELEQELDTHGYSFSDRREVAVTEGNDGYVIHEMASD